MDTQKGPEDEDALRARPTDYGPAKTIDVLQRIADIFRDTERDLVDARLSGLAGVPKRLVYVATVILSLFCSWMAILAFDSAFQSSDHPIASLVMRFIFAAAVGIGLISKKRRMFVTVWCMSFPFMNVAFNGIELLTVFTVILIAACGKEILTLSKTSFSRRSFGFLVLCFAYTSMLSHYPFAALGKIVFFLSLSAWYLALSAHMRSLEDIRRYATLLLIVYSFCILISSWQLVFGIESIRFFFGSYNANTYSYVVPRIPSVFMEAQGAGQYFAVMFLVCLGVSRAFVPKSIALKLLAVLGLVAVGLTVSRIAIVSLILLFGATAILLPHKRSLLPTLVILAGAVLGAAAISTALGKSPLTGWFSRFDSGDVSESSFFRFALWRESFAIFLANPFGVGMGGENLYYAATSAGVGIVGAIFGGNGDFIPYTHFENSYLDLLYSLGWLGLLAVIGVVLAFFRTGVVLVQRNRASPTGVYALHLMSAAAVWLICAGSSPLVWNAQSMILLTSLFAMMNSLHGMTPQQGA